MAFAILANEAIHGHATSLPAVTGASHRVVLGSSVSEALITLGSASPHDEVEAAGEAKAGSRAQIPKIPRTTKKCVTDPSP